MSRMTAGEAWEGFVGDQTPEEFMDYARQAGQQTVEEAVDVYVADLPQIMEADFSTEELEDIASLLTKYIKEQHEIAEWKQKHWVTEEDA